MMPSEADFVIVGGGSAGCVLANRLSADGRHKVVLVEAGPRDTSPWIHLPIGYGKTMWDKRVNWGFYTEPDPHMGGRKIYWPRGKVLGGSSSINGLIAIRGQREDYDHWEQLGNPGWGWNSVLPYFKKLEDNSDPGAMELRGTHGPLKITRITQHHELIDAVIRSAELLAIPRTDDFNGPTQEGAGYYQLTTNNGLRMSSATAYLKPAKGRANLTIMTHAHATGIEWTGTRVSRLKFRWRGQDRTIKANIGVVMCAGALQSPQLLMLSGIGPAGHLKDHGIPVTVRRDSVGENMQDHLQIRLIYKCSKPITTNDQLNSMIGRIRIGAEWLFKRSGPLAIGINQGGLFTRVLPESTTPDIQFHIATLSADMAGAKPHPFSGFTLSVCQLRPTSRGSLKLASADPLDPPRMYSNYLDTDTDRQCVTSAIMLARKLAQTKPLADYVAVEFLPGPKAQSDADMLQFARDYGATIFHPSGTCRMGSDPDAVVDPQLRVRGVEGLWVADCSIMPTLVSGNTNLPAIMIGEKAADMILFDAKRRK